MDFNVKASRVFSGSFADIIMLREFYGLSKKGKTVLLPAFDEVMFSVDGKLAYCRIDDNWMVYGAEDGKEILHQSLPDIPIQYDAFGTLEVVKGKGCHGLFDLFSRTMLLEARYDEVDPCPIYSHLWVRRGEEWGFVEKASGREALFSGMTMAFEADGGLFLQRNDEVMALDSEWHFDPFALRKYVISNQGRGTAHNDKYHISVVFDVYGNIL